MYSRSVEPASAAAEGQPPAYFSDNLPTLKCVGKPMFRSRESRDLACLLDIDPDIRCWSTPSPAFLVLECFHRAEFSTTDHAGTVSFLDTIKAAHVQSVDIDAAARRLNASYRLVEHEEIYDSGFRLPNARDLLKYARVSVTLADRVRLLGLLDQEGSLPMSDCLGAIRNTEPVAAIASMILHRFIDVELDDAILGPETMVRRIRG